VPGNLFCHPQFRLRGWFSAARLASGLKQVMDLHELKAVREALRDYTANRKATGKMRETQIELVPY
jgi:hypothetical protein